jgi:hypothetical protein
LYVCQLEIGGKPYRRAFMKDIQYYEEIPDNTVVALDTTREKRPLPQISSVANPPQVWCCYGCSAPLGRDRTLITYHAIPVEYLRIKCRRITERQARALHPEVAAWVTMMKPMCRSFHEEEARPCL